MREETSSERRTPEPAPLPRDPDAWIDEQQTSEEIGIPVRTLQGLRLKGGGPPFSKFNRLVRYNRRLNTQWAMARLRNSTSEK